MGFGKKKKQAKQTVQEPVQAPVQKPVKLSMDKNPLYPPKTESELKEILIALGTSVVCLALVVLIFSNFSYAAGNYPASQSGYYSSGTTQNTSDDDTVENPESAGGTTSTDDTVDEPDVSSEDPDTTAEDSNGIGKVIPDEETDDTEISDYVIADSDSRYVTTDDLKELSKDELSYARNEIYARHGRKFKDDALQSYFDSKEWYHGTIAPNQFSEGMLNKYEKKNAATILSYEKSKGYK